MALFKLCIKQNANIGSGQNAVHVEYLPRMDSFYQTDVEREIDMLSKSTSVGAVSETTDSKGASEREVLICSEKGWIKERKKLLFSPKGELVKPEVKDEKNNDSDTVATPKRRGPKPGIDRAQHGPEG